MKTRASVEQVLLYLPVIHEGYRDFLERHSQAHDILIIGEKFETEFPVLKKEIRALTPYTAARHVELIVHTARVQVVQPESLKFAVYGDVLIVPDEQLMHEIVDTHDLAIGRSIVWEPTFLRWDRTWSRPQSIAHLPAEQLVEPHASLMDLARAQAKRSSDWWRQVGAVLRLQSGELVQGHNEHHPSDYSPYISGDPRNDFHRGERPDLTTALHAEASVIGHAAREGLATRGSALYVTTFPCPSCARLIVSAGVNQCFFEAPYSILSGEDVLKAGGVTLHSVGIESRTAPG